MGPCSNSRSSGYQPPILLLPVAIKRVIDLILSCSFDSVSKQPLVCIHLSFASKTSLAEIDLDTQTTTNATQDNDKMKLSLYFLSLLSQLAATSTIESPQHIFSNPEKITKEHRIPTVRESAAMARKMLRLESIGTLSTTFPVSKSEGILENRPASVEGLPLGLMEYFADCEPDTGNPTILAVNIASTIRNVADGSNITLSLRWHPHYHHPFSAAKLPRFALVGTLEDMSSDEIQTQRIKSCYSKYHPDSLIWQPGNDIHVSRWVRFVTKEVYWFGGFGDRAYIGWIPLETWQSITEDEIKAAKLPGEKKGFWKHWLGKFEL